MDKIEPAFKFLDYVQKITEGVIEFKYQFGELYFTERLFLAPPTNQWDSRLVNTILDNLSLIIGISYWKAFCPRQLDTGGILLSKPQSEFWQTVYQKGLGEFFYRNQIDFHGLINFPITDVVANPISLNLQDRSLVFLGGGKDSLVTAELLRQAKKDFTLLTINEHSIQTALIQQLESPVIRIRRELDPQLLDLNLNGKVYNGHVPFTAINSFIGLLVSALYDFKCLVMSNERSSNYGNLDYLGEEINHQWSKSLEFELLFEKYVTEWITPGVNYFSLLRPFTELKIVELFSHYSQYFSLFSSCNRNFRKVQPLAGRKWCGECPKCAFIFLSLAAFLPKKTVIDIFQKNLFTDETLIPVFSELLGLTGHKPFECVGTPDEVKYAFYLISQKGEYNEDIVYQKLVPQVLPKIVNPSMLHDEIFSTSTEHSISGEFMQIITNL